MVDKPTVDVLVRLDAQPASELAEIVAEMQRKLDRAKQVIVHGIVVRTETSAAEALKTATRQELLDEIARRLEYS